jgi:hypothetical protein
MTIVEWTDAYYFTVREIHKNKNASRTTGCATVQQYASRSISNCELGNGAKQRILEPGAV